MERLYIRHWKTNNKGRRTKDKGQKCRLGGGNETQQQQCPLGYALLHPTYSNEAK